MNRATIAAISRQGQRWKSRPPSGKLRRHPEACRSPMDALPRWISQHALTLWAVVLILALLIGDLGWRRARRPLLAVLFGLLVWAVWAQTTLVRFDAALAQDLHDRLSPGMLQAIDLVTQLGDPVLIALAAGVVALVLALRRRWRLCVPWCVALGGTAGSGHVIKQFVQRPRPFGGHGFIAETGFSFPSGHAAGSMVFFGLLAYLLLRQWPPPRHRDTIAAAVTLVTVIGLSRVLLQAHYLSDVLAGYALGAF